LSLRLGFERKDGVSIMLGAHIASAPERSGIQAWIPEYGSLGYSRAEAEELARMAETLWNRYTAEGLTIDSVRPTPTALDPVEVLVQAVCHFGLRELFGDDEDFGEAE
jgi:hypothetical protein